MQIKLKKKRSLPCNFFVAMSFDKIILPDFIIADLYGDKLIKMNEPIKTAIQKPIVKPQNHDVLPATVMAKPATVEVKTTPLSYLGGNIKQISIVIRDSNAVHINDEWLQFLSNILIACRLSLGDVAIINAARHEIQFSKLVQELRANKLILFDVSPEIIGLPFTFPLYQLQNYQQTQILMAAPLSGMLGVGDQVKTEKTKLWLALKLMFGI